MFEYMSVLLDCLTVSSEEIVAVDDDNLYTSPIMAVEDILEFVQGSRPTGIGVINADCGAVGTGFESRRRHGWEERWEASDHCQSVLSRTEPNRTVACMLLKATANDRRHLALCHDEFRWP
ncbi:hypothetical protein TNCV_1240131 [Trichonephila clavipes]|uniref:Uncharacterized protein n=1 Tax=Trichonephila clavipes TaxID=2585209 RepID=A0A8X6WEL4_TRICX|nr:hypothetical protein TNCV_1240131 [Trichonephila clavipes]